MSADLPQLLILNQMAGPLTRELAEDLGDALGKVDLLTGHPDTLGQGSTDRLQMFAAPTYKRGNLLVRWWCWLRYCLCALFWLRKYPANIPILAFTNPPILLWLCWLVRRWRGTSYAIMVHDIYPDVIVRMGVASERNWLVRLWRQWNRQGYSSATAVMTLGPHMRKHIERQYDADSAGGDAVRVIPPWADTKTLTRIEKSENWFAVEHKQENCLTVMYSGNMGHGHDIESLLAAADQLRQDASVHFMFIGAGPKWSVVERFLQDRSPGADNVTLLPWQEESVIPYSLATADLSVVSLEPELTGLAIPSKAYYFLAAGAPILALSEPESELTSLVAQFDCGFAVRPGDVANLVASIQTAKSNEGTLARWREGAARARQHHSRQKNTQLFLQVLRESKLIPSAHELEMAAG